jgi:prepilin-type processing-associated H-X9-DG protein
MRFESFPVSAVRHEFIGFGSGFDNDCGSGRLRQKDNSHLEDPNIGTSVNQGNLLYKAHRGRFDYVFNDGHVESLKMEQTIGTGTLTVPKGMWTMKMGD